MRVLMEYAIIGLLGLILGGIFWEGLHRQLDIQDAQNRAWTMGEVK
jgi:hypothetical protein